MDVAIVETGNGGDLQLLGNDLELVFGYENNPYLAMFGGNIEQSTENKEVNLQSFDWWANALLMPSNQSIQMNSIVERTINSTPLTSSGRVLIENAIKKDLEFMSDFAKVEVSVTIVSTDRINVKIIVKQSDASQKITIVNFRKTTDGDFFILDFNNDFNL